MVCQGIIRVHSDDALGDVSRRADQRFVATLDEDNVGTGKVAVIAHVVRGERTSSVECGRGILEPIAPDVRKPERVPVLGPLRIRSRRAETKVDRLLRASLQARDLGGPRGARCIEGTEDRENEQQPEAARGFGVSWQHARCQA